MIYLKWVRPSGQVMISTYTFDGYGHQARFTRHGWICHCIAFGKREGFLYKGMSNETE